MSTRLTRVRSLVTSSHSLLSSFGQVVFASSALGSVLIAAALARAMPLGTLAAVVGVAGASGLGLVLRRSYVLCVWSLMFG